MKQIAIVIILICTYHIWAAPTSGYDENWFVPDIVSTKADPYNMIVSNFGQPAGTYNWNVNQFQLLGRQPTNCSGCTQNGKHVIIKDLKMYVNDQEYFITAVCYNPVPLGIQSMAQSSGIGGGGLCSSRRTPYATNDYKSACYDSDYFDGSTDPTRVPPGPTGWFDQIWARDFPIIKGAGANTIRIYNANPTTYLYTQNVIDGLQPAIDGEIVAPAEGKDHRPFMDAADSFGLKVIFPLLGDENLMTNLDYTNYTGLLKNQIDEIGDHPALLMYTLGNELNLAGDAGLLAKVNTYIQFSKNYSLTKWGRIIPFTHAIVDDPTTYNNLYAQLDVDVFTSNAGYRGLGFGDLWDGSQTPGFDGLGNLSLIYNKPNFIGEMGWEQINGSQTANPINAGWFNLKWKDLIQKGGSAGCIGGAFFEYSDEPYSKADPLQQSMGIVTAQVSTQTDQPTISALPPYTRPTEEQQTTPNGNTQNTTPSGNTQNTTPNGSTQNVSGSTQGDGKSTSVGGKTGAIPSGASKLLSGIFVSILVLVLVL